MGGEVRIAKRQETLELEEALIKDTRQKRIYGCEEVTIGFYNNGHGNEIVDFMTMDSKGIIKCYEIKVTLKDLKSNAKKSWYGHFNYLVVSNELYKQVDGDFSQYIPNYVGVIKGNSLCSERKCKRIEISQGQSEMLKESLVRSMYWKMIKYHNASDLNEHKKLNQKIRKLEKDRDYYQDRAHKAENLIGMYETYKCRNDGLDDYNFEQVVKDEKEKWLKEWSKSRDSSK